MTFTNNTNRYVPIISTNPSNYTEIHPFLKREIYAYCLFFKLKTLNQILVLLYGIFKKIHLFTKNN